MSYWKDRSIRNTNYEIFKRKSVEALSYLGILPTFTKQPKSEIIHSIPINIYNEGNYYNISTSKLVNLSIVKSVRNFLCHSGLQPQDILFELKLKQTRKHFFLVHFIQGELLLYPNTYKDNCNQMMQYLLQVNRELKKSLDFYRREFEVIRGLDGSNL